MTGSLPDAHLKAVRTLAGFGPSYFEDFVLPGFYSATKTEGENLEELVANLDDPILGLKVFFRQYAFSRRGKDRIPFGDAAARALRRSVEEVGADTLLRSADGERVWQEFESACQDLKIKPMEQLNRGIIQGMTELAQEIYRLPGQGSLCSWVRDAIENRGELTPVFERIVDIRGVGPKTTSCFLRDLIAVYDLEDQIQNVERLILHPIDRWVRQITIRYAPDLHENDPVDWVLAGKGARLARLAEVSGIDLNMGCTWFGLKQVRSPEKLDSALRTLERAEA